MKKISLFILILIVVLLPACAVRNRSTTFFAMNTVFTITVYGNGADAAVNACIQETNRLDSLFSVTNTDSDISKINASGGSSVEVSEDTVLLVESAKNISEKTGGAFDITVYPAVKLWGFTTGDYRVPTDEQINSVLNYVDYKNIQIDGNSVALSSGMSLDLGGIAKGYCSDKLKDILTDAGIGSALLSLGGNVYALGTKPDGSLWSVAIQDPADPAKYIGELKVRDKAVITSGGYNRYFEENGVRYSHIIDPVTCRPADSGLVSVTVIGDNGEEADALSTALYVMGTDKATEFCHSHSDIEVILVTDDNKLIISDSLQGKFSAENDSPYKLTLLSEAYSHLYE